MSTDFADLHRLFPGSAALPVFGAQGTARLTVVEICENLRNLRINL